MEINKKIDVKRAVSENRKVKFAFYREGLLYYSTEFGEQFCVPIDDTGNATFLAEDKALFFMRWMNKWNSDIG